MSVVQNSELNVSIAIQFGVAIYHEKQILDPRVLLNNLISDVVKRRFKLRNDEVHEALRSGQMILKIVEVKPQLVSLHVEAMFNDFILNLWRECCPKL